MTYSTAQKDYAAKLICAQFPNLHFGVARTWVTAEAGADNNVLGVTIGLKLQKYPTIEAGILAAATRIRTLGIYAPLLAAFTAKHKRTLVGLRWVCKSFTAHDTAQANALCRSPWNPGVAGLETQGGVSRYYVRIFSGRGYAITHPDDDRMRDEDRG